MLERVDRVVERERTAGLNRSRLIRQAVGEFVSRLENRAEDEREAAVVRRHRGRLARQAAALVRQATP